MLDEPMPPQDARQASQGSVVVRPYTQGVTSHAGNFDPLINQSGDVISANPDHTGDVISANPASSAGPAHVHACAGAVPITVHAQVASVEDSCVQSSGGRCDDNLRDASVQEILNICQAIPPTDLLLRFGQTPAIPTSHLWWFGGCPSLPENAVHSHTFQYSAYVSVVCRFVRRLMPCFPFMAIAIASNELLRRMEFPVANGSWLLLVPLSCSRSGSEWTPVQPPGPVILAPGARPVHPAEAGDGFSLLVFDLESGTLQPPWVRKLSAMGFVPSSSDALPVLRVPAFFHMSASALDALRSSCDGDADGLLTMPGIVSGAEHKPNPCARVPTRLPHLSSARIQVAGSFGEMLGSWEPLPVKEHMHVAPSAQPLQQTVEVPVPHLAISGPCDDLSVPGGYNINPILYLSPCNPLCQQTAWVTQAGFSWTSAPGPQHLCVRACGHVEWSAFP